MLNLHIFAEKRAIENSRSSLAYIMGPDYSYANANYAMDSSPRLSLTPRSDRSSLDHIPIPIIKVGILCCRIRHQSSDILKGVGLKTLDFRLI